MGRVNMPSFQTNALVVTPIGGDVSSNKAEFSFLQKKTAFWCSFKHLPNWRLVCLMYLLSQSLQVMVRCSFVTGSFGSAKICPKVWSLTPPPPFWAYNCNNYIYYEGKKLIVRFQYKNLISFTQSFSESASCDCKWCTTENYFDWK